MNNKSLDLKTKITITVTTLIIITVLVSVLITLYFGNKIGKSTVEERLASSQLIEGEFTQKRGRQLELISLLVASDPAFVAYIAQATYDLENNEENIDTASISDLLLERKQQYGFDLALVVSSDLFQLARSDSAMATKRDFSNIELVRKAAEELLPDSGYFRENNSIYQAAIVPLARGRNLIGFLITGLKINDEFANNIAKLSGTEVIVTSVNNGIHEPIASSMDVNYTSKYLSKINNISFDKQLLSNNKQFNLNINELKLATTIKALIDKDKSVYILNGVSVNQIVKPYVSTRNILLIAGIIMILLAYIIASLFVKKALSPLSRISLSTNNIANGNYQEKLSEDVSSDLLLLTSSINKLTNDIRGRESVSKHMIEISKKSHLTDVTAKKQFEDSTLIKIGDIISQRFEIIGNLGVGGMGHVYKAIDIELDEIVALKVLKGTYKQEKDINRFKDEIRLARRISHPNVVRTHDFGQLNDYVYITMEFVQGYTLEHLIKYSKKLRPYAARHAGIHICHGLIAAHASGVIHRDLKPANIIIELDSSIKLMDFGIATAQSSISKDKKDELVEGSSSYLSQEQILGKGADERTDIYAVGVLLMEMFTGKRPFYGSTEEEIMIKHVQESPLPISHYWADSPKQLENLILKCLAKKPIDRYQSVQAVLNDLLATKFD